ncbi:hypothetical protein JCM1841_003642 [Sporobolomyces salmonicolor]
MPEAPVPPSIVGTTSAGLPAVLPESLPGVTKFVPVSHEPAMRSRPALLFLRSADGRDAVLRLAQYSLRLVLFLRRSYLSSPTLARLLALVATLSALRRLTSLLQLLVSLRRLPSRVHPLQFSRHSTLASKRSSSTRRAAVDAVTQVARESLDLVAVVADNTYLFSRLRLVPLSPRTARRADKLSDYAALFSALLGLAQAARSRTRIWAEGRERRRKAVELEQKLEELEFWEPGPGKALDRAEAEARFQEERRLRERVKAERWRLRRFKKELDGLRWERLRLLAEGVFAVYDAFDLDLASEAVKSWSGATATVIGAGQAWADYFHP